MNSKYVTIIVFVIASVLAVVVGNLLVLDPINVAIGTIITLGIVVFLYFGSSIWLLIPASLYMRISFPFLPGEFSAHELVSIYVIGCSFVLFCMSKLKLTYKVTILEFYAVIIGLLMLQSYLRNPVGVNAFKSDFVGGRPYLVLMIGVGAGVLLAGIKTDLKSIQRCFKLSIWAFLLSSSIQALAYLSSSIASYTGAFLGVSGNQANAPGREVVDTGRATRNTLGSNFARYGAPILAALKNPLKALYHPFWLLILLMILAAAGLSGFRNIIGIVGLTLLLGIFYWGKMRSVFVSAMLAGLFYASINVVNVYYPFPANIQRSLSFLPGTWDEFHIVDANASTDWRVEMWEEALFTDRLIENKFLGDGLGIRRSSFSRIEEINLAPILTDDLSQERAILAGDFHSGPVTTVKTIGYLGLVTIFIAMFVVARRAHRLIMRSRNTVYFKTILFFCLPMLTLPIFFFFIYGSLKDILPLWFVQIGLLRLLENNFVIDEDHNS